MTYQFPRDARVPVITAIQVLVVSCGGVYVAMPADITRGILDPQEVGPDGTVTAVGVTYAMTDLVARLGLEHAGRSAEPKIVLCARREAAKAVYVEQVSGLMDVTRDQIHTLPMHFTEAERDWFAGLFLLHDNVTLLVNPAWLLGDEREAPVGGPVLEGRPSHSLPALPTNSTVTPDGPQSGGCEPCDKACEREQRARGT